jgi:N-acetylmuramoyl-L-alanine amidase
VAFAQLAPQGSSLTLLSREGRRPLPTTIVNNQEMVALDDLAALFQLTVREDALVAGVTVGYKGKTIVLTPDQALASVGGRLVSLPAPPLRSGRRWLVPVEFINRALALISDTRLDLRKTARLVLIGDVRVPRVVIRHELTDSQAHVTFDVSPPTPHPVIQEPGRLLIRFEAEALDATLPTFTSAGLIQAIRIQEPSTIVLELGSRFAAFRASDQPPENGVARTVIDVLPAAAETTPAPPASTPSPQLEPPPLLGTTPSTAIRTIVIDPGHGGDENGTRGASGTLEKDVTLSVARRLKGALENRLGVRALLTRDGDRRVELDERAAFANNNKADLFVSLHANASVRRSAKGAEVFYLNLDRYGDEARRQAALEAQSLPSFGGPAREIEVILWDLAQARFIDQSAALAATVEGELASRVPMSVRPLQEGPFRVLVGANMPAVLVEMGYLSNPDQEAQLKSSEFQTSLVSALFESVVRFRDHLDQIRARLPEHGLSRPGETRPVGERP